MKNVVRDRSDPESQKSVIHEPSDSRIQRYGTERGGKNLAISKSQDSDASSEDNSVSGDRDRTAARVLTKRPEDLEARLERIQAAKRRKLADRLERIKKAKAKRRGPEAKKNLHEFVRQAWATIHPGEPLSWNWHLKTICDHLQYLAFKLLDVRDQALRDPENEETYELEDKNLLINVPPRSLKTEICGVFFPAWLWLHDPSIKIRYLSGNGKVRTKAARASRDLISSEWYQQAFDPAWKIRPDIDAIELYQNSVGGERHSATTNEKITGEGSDIIIIDDPLDAKEANSELIRTGVNDKWDTAIENRVNSRKRCLRIGIMQRLHEEDWAGHVLAQSTWRHVRLPTEFEPSLGQPANKLACKCEDCRNESSILGKYDHREPGELLHPARLGGKTLTEEKAKGSYYFAGQHQQRPAPAEGGMFKKVWWRYYDPGKPLPTFRRIIIAVDCSAKKTVTGSRTSMLVFGESGPNRYILDNITKPMDILDMKKAIRKLRERFPKSTIVIEDKAAGSDVIVELRVDLAGIVDWDPKGVSKESRAFSVVGIVEGGNVLLPMAAPWLDDFIHETAIFPNGSHDDQIDSLSMGLSYLRGERALQRTKL
jgi:predicted phage terminase large subunit-like protein